MDQLKKLGQGGWTRVESLRYGLLSAGRAPLSTAADEAVRRRQGFPEIEAALPTGLHAVGETPILDRVLGFALGANNPLAREADCEQDEVWLLDNTAYRAGGGDGAAPWQAEFVAAYFERHSGRDLSDAVSSIADTIGVDDGHLGESERADVRRRIEARLLPFARAIKPARYLHVVHGARGHVVQLGPGDSNGISTQTIGELGKRDGKEVVRTNATLEHLTPYGSMETVYVEPEGWMVISDIDDSIKITMTSSPIGMLQSTFYDEPKPIEGMPELYKHIDDKLQPNWFYLSASPYNLYPFLRKFLRETYPHGTIVLRDASWQDLSGLLQSFTIGTEAYKTSRIEKMHSWLPNRKVICVGDSTQSDPEAYGNIARAYPGWIKAIFIRKVTGVKGMDQTTKDDPKRFEEAFKGLDKGLWKVFESAQELYQEVDRLTAG